MNKLFRPFFSLALVGSLLLTATSCGSDDPEPEEEEEVITAVTLSLSPTGKGQDAAATVSVITGTQVQNAPLTLKPGTEYAATITLTDESTSPATDRTVEIRNERNEHLLVYTFTPETGSNATVNVTITDLDQNNRPVGLESTVTTGAGTGNGKLKVVLKHQPGGLKTGTNTTAGTTDIDVDFNVIVAN
jgi:outer membrane receptor for ferrienterochelin and colicin